MFKLKSLAKFEIAKRGTVFVVESPITAERNFKAMRDAIGEIVELDGKEYRPIGFDLRLPIGPVHIGEQIGIIVQCPDQ